MRPWIYLLGLAALFPLTFHEQPPASYFSPRRDSSYFSLNNYSLTFLTQWLDRGLLSTGGKLILPAASDLEDPGGSAYLSYPSAYLLPAYAAASAAGARTTGTRAATLRWLAALNHLALALLLGGTVLALSGGLVAAWTSALLALFLPPLFHWQHNLWWPDFAGLTGAALLGFAVAAGAPAFLLGAAAALACSVDWFPCFLAAALLPILPGPRRWAVAAGAALPLAAHLCLAAGSLGGLWAKFLVRSGLAAGGGSSLAERLLAWLSHSLPWTLGWGLFAALALGTAALCARPEPRARRLWLAAAAAVTGHWLVFSEHYQNHYYNSVRWALLAALVPALLPRRLAYAAAPLALAWLASGVGKPGLVGEPAPLEKRLADACELVAGSRAPGRVFASAEKLFDTTDPTDYYPACRARVVYVKEPALAPRGALVLQEAPGGGWKLSER